MAGVKGPLLSMRASGQIGKSQVYGSWRGVPYARVHVIPANPKTVAQMAQRNLFSNIIETFKRMGALARAPWDAFAVGRPLLGRNVIVQSNVAVLKGQADMSDWIGSPGTKGGLPGTVLALNVAVAGQVTATLTLGAAPTGWVASSVIAVAQEQRAVDVIMTNPPTEAENAAPVAPGANAVVLATGAGTQVVTAWPKWTKPDGTFAYGPSLTAVGVVI